MDTQTDCHVSNQVNIHTDVTEVPDHILNDAFNELKDDFLYDGSVKIGTTHYNCNDLYQYGDEEEQARVISLAFRFPDDAKQLAEVVRGWRSCPNHWRSQRVGRPPRPAWPGGRRALRHMAVRDAI